ncbi:MAG: biotin/lipoyl-binding protein, partial [Coriobacteriia bacterium]|nr:biotin/lipoyl-binding protein [Coriobacteriia bacterium]
MLKRDPLVAPPAQSSREYTQQEITQAASELQAFKALEGRSAKHKRTKRRRVIVTITLVLLVLIIGVAILGSILGNPQQEGPQATALVTRGDFVDTIDVSGNLAAFEQVTITPEVDGTVSQLYVQEGDAVEAGQLLFTLDNPDLDQAVTRAQLGVDSANLNLSSAQASLNDAVWAQERAWENYLAMLEAFNNSVGQPVSEDLPTNPPLTQADVDQAYAAYRQSVSAVTNANLALSGASI